MWENNKAANKIPSWLRDENQQVDAASVPPLMIEKGCEDHLAVLISNDFAQR